MGLSIHNDPMRPSGGFAILKGQDLKGVSALTVENVYSGLFLGADGRWVKQPHAFAVGPAAADAEALGLGPDIVDFIPTELQVALRAGDGRDLGRVFWENVIPSRSREDRPASPVPVPEPVADVTPEPPPSPAPPPPVARPEPPPVAPPLPPPPAEPEAAAWPPKRRSFALPGTIAAMVTVGLAAGAYMVWHKPLPPDPDGGSRCARLFDVRLHTARGGTDADLVTLGEEALAAQCGRQAFDAIDAVNWETNEPAAWTLARFYDPNETASVYRQVALTHPTWAATYYLKWAPRSARMAEALKALCASDGPALDGDPLLKRGCGR